MTWTQREKPKASYSKEVQKLPKNNNVKSRKRRRPGLQIPETELYGDIQTKVKFGRI